jgi:hypothetical protein
MPWLLQLAKVFAEMRKKQATSSEVIQARLEVGESKDGRSPDLRELRCCIAGLGLWFHDHLGAFG